jgi:tRNA pseudouridine-54 N-methylase
MVAALVATAAMLSTAAVLSTRRDVVVVARGRMDATSEVRSLAQCATAALHLQNGMRGDTRLWLSLPDRGGLTVACDGAEAAMLPVLGKTIKHVLDADVASSLILPPGWQVHQDEALERRLALLGCCGPSSRQRAEAERKQALLQGRLDALRTRTDAPFPATTSPPIAPDGSDDGAPTKSREEALLAGRLAAMRLKAEMESEGSSEETGGPAAVAPPQPASDPLGVEPSRLIVLDGRAISPLLTPSTLESMGEDDPEDGGGARVGRTVVVVTADGASFTHAEARCLDSLGGVFVSASPLPLLPSHAIVLAHAALDVEAQGVKGAAIPVE